MPYCKKKISHHFLTEGREVLNYFYGGWFLMMYHLMMNGSCVEDD